MRCKKCWIHLRFAKWPQDECDPIVQLLLIYTLSRATYINVSLAGSNCVRGPLLSVPPHATRIAWSPGITDRELSNRAEQGKGFSVIVCDSVSIKAATKGVGTQIAPTIAVAGKQVGEGVHRGPILLPEDAQ